MRRTIFRLGILCLGVLPACQNNTNTAQPAAFDRPEDVVFFCLNTQDNSLVDLEECAPPSGDLTEANPERDDRALFAAVTQTTTGEVAAVRITGDVGEPGVVDSDVRLPGFTFAAVGEVPSALAYDQASDSVFVVSRGEGGPLHRVKVTSIVMSDAQGADAVLVKELAEGGPVRPAALEIVDGFIYIALPQRGQIMRMGPIGADGSLDDTQTVRLDLAPPDPLPAPVEITALPPQYRFTVGLDPEPAEAPVIPPRDPIALGTTPEPWELEVDALDPDAPVLLVADRALPIIHRIDLATFTELEPINVSVPTRALALTPFVPNSPSGEDLGTDRYLYAIDQTDRSVLVVHYDAADAELGAVLPVSVVEPFDRLDVPFGARAIEVLTPGYDGPDAIPTCVDDESGPAATRGVFLAVATDDGVVRFVDVYDADTPCRGDESNDSVVAIARHRPRIGELVEELITADPEPSWDTASGAAQVRNDGTNAATQSAPTLTPLDACPDRLGPVYGNAQSPVLCAVTDPWAATAQNWTVTYEGALPFTGTTGASLQPGEADQLVVLTGSDACVRGVLGANQVPADGPLAGYPGDVVAITADLPPSVLMGDPMELERCTEITQRTTAGAITPLLLPILDASVPDADDPELLGNVSRLVVGPPIGVEATAQEVLDCYPELVELEVRTRDALLVSGTLVGAVEGFVHPVVRDEATGACVVDPELVAQDRRARARFGAPFSNGRIAFALGEEPPQIRSATLTVQVREVPQRLALDVSQIGRTTSTPSLLVSLAYNEVDERLYVVDQSTQGLVRVNLRGGVTVAQTFR